MTYEEVEKEILDIPKFAGKNSLEATAELLRFVIGGECKSKIIHIAGTNGKGSVCAYLRSILMKSGCTVAMFTSPHLVSMRERICVGTDLISEQDFVRIYETVQGAVRQSREKGISHPSFFEYLFLMAMLYFREKEPEYIILETGMGGRLDATNCIESPVVCVITKIGFDHMQYLGNSIQEIAAQKAGIIKKGVPVVFGNQNKVSAQILTEYAKRAKAPAIIIENDNILNVNIHNKSIDFSLHTGYYNYISLSLDTVALYQTQNASLAVNAAEVLKDKRITSATIAEGLWATHWPGRMEEIRPGIYLDGAHNEDGIEAFLETVSHMTCKGKKLLLFGVVEDKKYEKMIQKIEQSGLFQQAAITTLASERSVSSDKLREIWRQYKEIDCSFHESAKEAYQHLALIKKAEDIIYIAGSLYLVGQMESLIRRTPDD